MNALTYDQAQGLVASVYKTLDLFSNSEMELGEWVKTIDSDGTSDTVLPNWFDAAEKAALTRALYDCGVVREDTTIDRYRLLEFQKAVELLPHFRAQEVARRPPPKAQVVFTVPNAVVLPREATYLRHSLAARVCEALASAEDRVLLASPYWSDQGAETLWDATAKARELHLCVTLAGAKRDPGSSHDHFAAMCLFGARLREGGANVRCLEFIPPIPGAIFHAKIVCGSTGYLGSGNMTDSALGTHVEAGVPLGTPDISQVWWLVETLVTAGLLREYEV